MEVNWTIISSLGTVCAALFSGIALIFMSYSSNKTSNTLEYQILKNTFDDLLEAENDLQELNKSQEIVFMGTVEQWDKQYFNKIELFAFMVNLGHVRMKHARFFKEQVINAYEKNYATFHKKEVENPNSYPEFKKLYLKFKSL